MRKALVVGINYYASGDPLHGCVNDAHEVKAVLERHGDGSVNFSVKPLMGSGAEAAVSKAELRQSIQELFRGDSETALLYFAGHGHISETGGYLLASDSPSGEDGVPLSDVLVYANNSGAKNRVIILDSCHSGIAGNPPTASGSAQLTEGLTILTASTAEQYASEENGHGVFTNLLVDALAGAAANLMGAITPGSVYAHIDQSLGPWEQRPVFKTNVKNFVSLRTVQPPVDLSELRRIKEFFPEPGFQFQLDPSFEPEREAPPLQTVAPNPENTAKFAILQKLNRVNLVKPVDAPHMYHAAMNSKTCALTVLGEHYRQLLMRERI